MKNYKLALSHFLAIDPVIHQLLSEMDQFNSSHLTPDQYFAKLCRNIVGQQLSVKVADVIIKRFEEFVGEIKPESILSHEDQQLRNLGLSWAKIKYVKDLATKTSTQELKLELLPKLENEAVILELTKVKGIGRWTAEMFLIFTLGREDVFSYGDLGLRRAIEKLYNFPKDTKQDLFEPIVEKWKPYRSYASLALWHSLDNKPK